MGNCTFHKWKVSTTQNGLVSNNRMEVSVETYGKTADVDGDRILHQPYVFGVIQVAIFHTQWNTGDKAPGIVAEGKEDMRKGDLYWIDGGAALF